MSRPAVALALGVGATDEVMTGVAVVVSQVGRAVGEPGRVHLAATHAGRQAPTVTGGVGEEGRAVGPLPSHHTGLLLNALLIVATTDLADVVVPDQGAGGGAIGAGTPLQGEGGAGVAGSIARREEPVALAGAQELAAGQQVGGEGPVGQAGFDVGAEALELAGRPEETVAQVEVYWCRRCCEWNRCWPPRWCSPWAGGSRCPPPNRRRSRIAGRNSRTQSASQPAPLVKLKLGGTVGGDHFGEVMAAVIDEVAAVVGGIGDVGQVAGAIIGHGGFGPARRGDAVNQGGIASGAGVVEGGVVARAVAHRRQTERVVDRSILEDHAILAIKVGIVVQKIALQPPHHKGTEEFLGGPATKGQCMASARDRGPARAGVVAIGVTQAIKDRGTISLLDEHSVGVGGGSSDKGLQIGPSNRDQNRRHPEGSYRQGDCGRSAGT